MSESTVALLWFLFYILGVPMILVVIVGGLSIYVMNREKRDPEFSEKMDRFRAPLQKLFIGRKAQLFIVGVIVIALILYYASSGEIHHEENMYPD